MQTFDGMAHDEVIGWYDPNEMYCSYENEDGTMCRNRAAGENVMGIVMIAVDSDGFCETVEAVCLKHRAKFLDTILD